MGALATQFQTQALVSKLVLFEMQFEKDESKDLKNQKKICEATVFRFKVLTCLDHQVSLRL